MTTKTERVERTEDWTRCLCGNEPHLDGFYCSDADGTIRENGVDIQPEPTWDQSHMTCWSCGRTFVLETRDVVGQTSDGMLAGARAYVEG
jgi:hypothetical protein